MNVRIYIMDIVIRSREHAKITNDITGVEFRTRFPLQPQKYITVPPNTGKKRDKFDNSLSINSISNFPFWLTTIMAPLSQEDPANYQ